MKKDGEQLVYYKEILLATAVSAPLGIIVGGLATVFGKFLLVVTNFRMENPVSTIPWLGVAGLLIVFLYKKVGAGTEKGMGLIFSVAHREEEKIPLRLIPLVMLTTWITHLFGGSAGREGVAVQIGATVFDTFEAKLPFSYEKKILLTAGVAAGFAGLFQTPIAATFFALEVFVVGEIQINAFFPALVAAYSACWTSSQLGLEQFTFQINDSLTIDPLLIFKLILIGVLFGIVGGAFAYLLRISKKHISNKIPNPYSRIFIIGVISSVLLLLLHTGRYSGLGTNLISASFQGGTVYSYDWILKIAFTIMTLSAGFTGGEVTPLFSIGASLGVILAKTFCLPIPFVAALGYVGVFSSATNTFLTPIFIGAEVFGYEYLPFFFLITAISYFANGNQSIYTQKKKNF